MAVMLRVMAKTPLTRYIARLDSVILTLAAPLAFASSPALPVYSNYSVTQRNLARLQEGSSGNASHGLWLRLISSRMEADPQAVLHSLVVWLAGRADKPETRPCIGFRIFREPRRRPVFVSCPKRLTADSPHHSRCSTSKADPCLRPSTSEVF